MAERDWDMGDSECDHITHFDDCGCKSKRLEAEIARLKAECDSGSCSSAMHERMASAQAVPMHEMKRLEVERDAAHDSQIVWQKKHAKLLTERDALRLRVAALEAACLEVRRWFDPKDTHGNFNTSRHMVAAINAALSGDTSALRELLVEACMEAWVGRGYPSEGAASKSALALCIADRILKGGSQ
jgi:hypothetical protein